jgi:RNA polymerase sigma factor (sigma-70 family)
MGYSPSANEMTLLSQVIAQVARAGRLYREDGEDFAQSVQLRMVERGYDVFPRFSGRSSLRTYLTVVVRRLLLDWRNATKGKWRPSAQARRLGPAAVALERLVYRDGYLPHEAAAALAGGGHGDVARLRALLEQLPARQRVVFVSDCDAEAMPTMFVDLVEEGERRRVARRVRRLLSRSIARLPHEDRTLVEARYGRGESVQSVANRLNQDPKRMYRRFDRLLRQLKESVQVGSESACATDELR